MDECPDTLFSYFSTGSGSSILIVNGGTFADHLLCF